MSPRRSKLEIRLTILSAIKDGVDKPTRIMYAANLSWKPTQGILTQLIDQELVNEVIDEGSSKSRRRYEVTEKGRAVLKYFDEAKRLLPIEEVYSQG
ncbi:MAG TPA: winged helix-turn-helix domain-containing protein [Patescibacteria group bacterium]|nr:winged helix-turn-helix domain-containing protein [Patescibacteria group bacterium]